MVINNGIILQFGYVNQYTNCQITFIVSFTSTNYFATCIGIDDTTDPNSDTKAIVPNSITVSSVGIGAAGYVGTRWGFRWLAIGF